MFQTDLHWVQGIGPHRLALMPRPRGGEWLEDEIAGWCEASVNVVVSLLEAHEIRELGLHAQPQLCERSGIEFLHLPIADRGVPPARAPLLALVNTLHSRLQQGQAVAVHCRAGIGRTGLVAGCLLHLLGVHERDIFHLLSRSRGVAMPDTSAQADWVEQFCRSQNAR
jgi:protein-tyrosine phosphatase